MVIDFNSTNAPSGASRNSQANNAAGKRDVASDTAEKAPTTATKEASTDRTSFSLSPQAQQFQAIEERLRDLPEVDSERVNQIKQAIADGSYQVDSKRIADKLLSLES